MPLPLKSLAALFSGCPAVPIRDKFYRSYENLRDRSKLVQVYIYDAKMNRF